MADCQRKRCARLELERGGRSFLLEPADRAAAGMGSDPETIHRPTVLDAFVHLPLVLPPVVVGYLLLVLFGTWAHRRLVRSHVRHELIFTRNGAALATAVMSFPLMVRPCASRWRMSIAAWRSRAHARENALDRFVTVTLPLMLPGVLAGAITAFSAALGEFGRSSLSFPNFRRNRTLPRRCIRRCKRRAATAMRRAWSPLLRARLHRPVVVRIVYTARAGHAGPVMLKVAAKNSAAPFLWTRNSSCQLRGLSDCSDARAAQNDAGQCDRRVAPRARKRSGRARRCRVAGYRPPASMRRPKGGISVMCFKMPASSRT